MRALQNSAQLSRVLRVELDTSRPHLKTIPGSGSRSQVISTDSRLGALPRFPRAATKMSRRHCYVGCMAKLVDSFLNNYT